MSRTEVSFRVNGYDVTVEAHGSDRLLDVLRTQLQLTGAKEGCAEGECGACTVLLDGKAINSCLLPAVEAEGHEITTIEGLAQKGQRLSVLQESFVAHFGIQCGFCTPGMILTAKALLDTNPHPTEAQIREAIRGNLCRCTGYTQIVEAISKAAEACAAAPESPPSSDDRAGNLPRGERP